MFQVRKENIKNKQKFLITGSTKALKSLVINNTNVEHKFHFHIETGFYLFSLRHNYESTQVR